MSIKCNVIIYESQKGFSEKLREYLRSKGAASHIVSSMKDMSQTLKSLALPIMIAELPENQSKIEGFIDELAKVPKILEYPVIAAGNSAKKFEEKLSSLFKLAVCFDKPVSSAEIWEALSNIAETFDFPVQDSAAISRSNVIAPPNRAETAVNELDEAMPASELYSGFESIPDLFFDELNKYNLLAKDFSGKEYVTFVSENSQNKEHYLAPEIKDIAAFKELSAKLPEPLVTRIHRVAYLSTKIISNITDDPALLEHSRAAAFLFNWSLIGEQKTYLRKDYFSLKSKAFRKDLCSKVKDSAMKCAVELAKTKVAEIVSKIGKYIGLEEQVADNPVSMIASTIAAVDMVDRACWQNNHFNPRAAYKIMVAAKSGQLTELHPVVLCCLVKMLSEALASNIKVFLVPRKLRNNPELIEAAKRIRDAEVKDGERKVEINELTPGMRLSRPLVAFDGREILEQDMVLDQDLIWRIWQLSMVRALNSPLVVETEN